LGDATPRNGAPVLTVATRPRLGAVLVALAALALPHAAPAAPATQTLYVSPSGADTNAGDQSAPLQTIQAALDRAAPGTTIVLGPGAYHEEPRTKVDGTPTQPITIQGPETGQDASGRHLATLYGTSRILNIDNNWYTIRGFTIDGEEKLQGTQFPAAVADAEAFKDSIQKDVVASKLLFVGSADTATHLTGIVVDDMDLHASGSDCVHIRNAAHGILIERSVIDWCGMKAQEGGAHLYRYHNGEGIYVGTSPQSTSQPMHADDETAHVTVKDNRIATYGSECFDVKENAHDNRLQHNQCLDNTEPRSFGGSDIELRGYANQIVSNAIAGSQGYALKIAADGSQYRNGGNSVRGNVFSTSRTSALRIVGSAQQGLFCGNRWSVGGAAEVVPPTPPKRRPGQRRPRCPLR
jgi:hypothetical protein